MQGATLLSWKFGIVEKEPYITYGNIALELSGIVAFYPTVGWNHTNNFFLKRVFKEKNLQKFWFN